MDPALSTQIELVGPNSPNSDRGLYRDSWKNLGPAVGFSWQLPWFGKEKTNVRGDYQITYAKPGNLANLVNNVFLNPGFSNLAQTNGPLDGSYFDLQNLPNFIPITPATQPLQPVPLIKQNQAIYAFDPNYKTPYIQNLTLSVTRDVARNVTVDVRYIGTRGLKLDGSMDLNSPDVFYNSKLFNALETTRRGGDDPLFDQMFLGLNLNPGVAGCDRNNPADLCGPVNGTTQTGSQALRLSQALIGTTNTFRQALANGDYATLAGALNVFNGTGAGSSNPATTTGTVNFGVSGERGTVLKRANLGFNVPGGNSGPNIPANIVVPAGLFPANWISANPQVSSANYYNNNGKSNYHSLQMQTTIRAAQGLTFQGTYVWSRSLGISSNTYTNPADRDSDYVLAPTHVTHDFRTNGTYALPIGPNKLLFGNTSGWIARAIEGWETSFIANMTSGNPVNITGGNTLYANGVPDVVGPFSSKSFGHVQWNRAAGNYFGTRFGQVTDPQCGQVAPELTPYCSLQAITDARTGQVLLQNARPGRRGTLGQMTMELPGTWAFDAALTKQIRISETKRFQLRMDATDVLNHPDMGRPTLDMNNTNPFGSIQAKGTQHRQFKAMMRLDF